MKKTFDIWTWVNKLDGKEKELAEKAGISRRAIQYYMSGREPQLPVLIKIADIFGVKVAQLFK